MLLIVECSDPAFPVELFINLKPSLLNADVKIESNDTLPLGMYAVPRK